MGAIALLELLSASDTVDRLVALDVLQNLFVVTGSALAWFSSYLADWHRVALGTDPCQD